MSGGSWDYAYRHLEDLAGRLAVERDPHRVALGRRIALCAEAARMIERVDSCDSAAGADLPAIMAATSNAEVLAAASDRLREVILEAEAVRKRLGQSSPEGT